MGLREYDNCYLLMIFYAMLRTQSQNLQLKLDQTDTYYTLELFLTDAKQNVPKRD